MPDNKLELVVEIDTNRANASIKSVNSSLSSMEAAAAKSARGASAGIDGLTASMVRGEAAGTVQGHTFERALGWLTVSELGHAAQDHFLLNIMASFAEFEREMIVVRIADTRARLRAERRRMPVSIAPKPAVHGPRGRSWRPCGIRSASAISGMAREFAPDVTSPLSNSIGLKLPVANWTCAAPRVQNHSCTAFRGRCEGRSCAAVVGVRSLPTVAVAGAKSTATTDAARWVVAGHRVATRFRRARLSSPSRGSIEMQRVSPRICLIRSSVWSSMSLCMTPASVASM